MVSHREEITRRIAKLRNSLADRDLDAFVSVKLVNTYYLSGFTSLDTSRPTSYVRPVVVLIHSAGSSLIIPELDAEAATHTSAIEDIRVYSAAPPSVVARQLTVQWLSEVAVRRVGIEEDAMTAEWADYIRRSLPQVELVFAGDLVVDLRMHKDELELECMRTAAKLSDLAVAGSLSGSRPGGSEIGAETQGILQLREGAAAYLHGSFIDSISLILSGARASMPHEFTTARVIEEGDVAWHCWLVSYRGYWVENVRTSVAGRRRDFDRAFAILLDSLLAGQEMARPGIAACDVYGAVMRVLKGNPVPGGVILTRSGHGVGLEYHEPPFLEDGDETPLDPGTVITVEPGIWMPGTGGLTLSNTLVISEKGSEVITQAPLALHYAV